MRRFLPALLLLMFTLPAWAQSPPAQIDRATPRAQNGLTVLAIVRGDAEGQYAFPVPPELDFLQGPRSNGPPGGIGLWVRGAKPLAPPKGSRPAYSDTRLTVSARAPNGDTLPAQASTASGGSYFDSRSSPTAPLFLVTMPGDYPIGYPAIDVNLSDGQRHSARWRLVRLAPTFHAIAGRVVPKTVFHGAGVTLTARAYPSQNQGADWAGVQYQFDAQVPPGTHWLLRVSKQQLEWDALRPGERDALQTRYGRPYGQRALWTTTLGDDSRGTSSGKVRTPFAKYNHFLRLSGTLVQMATADESLTFRNIALRQSKPPPQFGRGSYVPPPSYEIISPAQTQTTPSGLSLSILPQSALPRTGDVIFGSGGDNNTIHLGLKFAPTLPGQSDEQRPLLLPRSPLFKKYHKPVTYFVRAQKPYYLQYFPYFDGGHSLPGTPPAPTIATLQRILTAGVPLVRRTLPGRPIMLVVPPPPPMPRKIDTLTFDVSQRAELRSLPVSFVVPVGPAPPPVARRPPLLSSPTLNRQSVPASGILLHSGTCCLSRSVPTIE